MSSQVNTNECFFLVSYCLGHYETDYATLCDMDYVWPSLDKIGPRQTLVEAIQGGVPP